MKSIRNDKVLQALFTSRARVDVLKLFFLQSSRRHYVREVAALTEQPLRAVQRELARLEGAGILHSQMEGIQKYYQADRNSPVFSELRALLVKTAGFALTLRDALSEDGGLIRIAFIFGSFAKGTEEGPVTFIS